MAIASRSARPQIESEQTEIRGNPTARRSIRVFQVRIAQWEEPLTAAVEGAAERRLAHHTAGIHVADPSAEDQGDNLAVFHQIAVSGALRHVMYESRGLTCIEHDRTDNVLAGGLRHAARAA